MFSPASKKQAKLRAALLGPAGSGKTYTALKVGRALVGPSGKIAVMDTEHGSASKYADLFSFDTVAPDQFSVDTYIEIIAAAGGAGYDLLILDSLSHAWAGKGGLLEFVDAYARRNSGNSFGAWRDATPKHNDLVEAMLACPCHLVVTMRVKMEHVIEKDPQTGKNTIRKMGLQPVQRDGLEYEFDVVGDLSADNELSISKTRCSALKGKYFREPGEDVAAVLRGWLSSGEAEAPKTPGFTPAKPVALPAPATPPRPTNQAPSTNLATPAQVQAIYSIAESHHNLEGSEVDERSMAVFGVVPVELTRKQASEFIEGLKAANEAVKPAPSATTPEPSANGDAITPAQLRAIYTIGRKEHGFLDPETEDQCIAVFGVRPSALTKTQASTFITNMQSKARA